MSDIKIIDGEIFRDNRGEIYSLNSFILDGIKRFYVLHHPDTSVIRGWHGHQFEKKWFYCIKGSFTVGFVKIDDWENPNKNLTPQIFSLSDKESKIICLPEGYANCIKAIEPNSIMMVYSDKTLEEAKGDSWRYDNSMWMDWTKY